MGLLLILVVMLLGGDPAALLTLLTGETGAATTPASPPTGGDDEVGDFVAPCARRYRGRLGRLFARSGERYPAPTLVLYNDSVQSACGFSSAATGPFYLSR